MGYSLVFTTWQQHLRWKVCSVSNMCRCHGARTNFYRVYGNGTSNRTCVRCTTHVSVCHRNNTYTCDYNLLGHFFQIVAGFSVCLCWWFIYTNTCSYIQSLLFSQMYMYECHVRCSCMYFICCLNNQSHCYFTTSAEKLNYKLLIIAIFIRIYNWKHAPSILHPFDLRSSNFSWKKGKKINKSQKKKGKTGKCNLRVEWMNYMFTARNYVIIVRTVTRGITTEVNLSTIIFYGIVERGEDFRRNKVTRHEHVYALKWFRFWHFLLLRIKSLSIAFTEFREWWFFERDFCVGN